MAIENDLILFFIDDDHTMEEKIEALTHLGREKKRPKNAVIRTSIRLIIDAHVELLAARELEEYEHCHLLDFFIKEFIKYYRLAVATYSNHTGKEILMADYTRDRILKEYTLAPM